MKIIVSYLNFVFFIEIKAISKYKIFNFVFQFIKKTKWYFGYTDCQRFREIFQEVINRRMNTNSLFFVKSHIEYYFKNGKY